MYNQTGKRFITQAAKVFRLPPLIYLLTVLKRLNITKTDVEETGGKFFSGVKINCCFRLAFCAVIFKGWKVKKEN